MALNEILEISGKEEAKSKDQEAEDPNKDVNDPDLILNV